MSDQRDRAAAFELLAAMMEISGANAFRINATRKVARVLEDYEGDLRAAASAKGALEALDGIGKSSAERIREWYEHGTIADLETLRSEIPPGLIGLLEVSGLGPKTVGLLWREAAVVDSATLREAINDGRLAPLPRMGAQTSANISDLLDVAENTAEGTLSG